MVQLGIEPFFNSLTIPSFNLKPWLKPLKSQLFESNCAGGFVWVGLWTTLMSLNSLGKKRKKKEEKQNTT